MTKHTLSWIAHGGCPGTANCDYLWLSPDLQRQLKVGGIGNMSDWVESGLSEPVLAWADLATSP